MTTQQMHDFITLAKRLNYTTAASELQVSVSSLSRQIKMLENELNVQLLYRDNRNVRLTACGKHFFQEIQKNYEQYQQIKESTRAVYRGYNGSVKIGFLDDLTLNGAMQDYLERFRRKYPDLTLHLERGSYKQLTEGVLSGKYDCIFCFFFAIDTIISLKYKVVENITEGILISAKNPLSQKKYFDPAEFKTQTFIILSPDENDYVSSEPFKFCRQNGFSTKFLYAPNLDSATLMVEAGLGVSFSYSKSVGSYNPSMKFIPLKEGLTMTHCPKLALAWNDTLDNPSAELFVNEF